MRGTFSRAVVGAAAISAFSFGTITYAQSADSAATETVAISAGIATYSPAFFTTYVPVTALDMVTRIPGFSLSNGDTNRRGLGDSFGNLLIDGARPSNKSLTLQTVLQRIPADDVERIELIQEALPQYDMRGHPRLVNVILREGAGNSGSYNLRLARSASNRLGPRAIASYTTQLGDAEVTFGIDTGWSGNRVRRREELWDAGTTLTEVRRDNDQRHYQEATPSISLNWPLSERSTLRLDTRANIWEWRRTQWSFVDQPVAGGDGLEPLRLETNSTENHGSSYSVNATFSHDLSDTITLQTIALMSRERWDDGPEAFQNYDAVTGFTGATIVNMNGEYEETALRGTLSWNPNERHALELGAETAVNARDTSLRLDRDNGTTITPISLPVADTRVEETRSELFINHTWTINDRFNLESGLRYESSEITQTGDANQTRTFNYAKPSVTLNWRQDDRNRLRVTARRDVAQLSFGKFASSVDVADNNSTLGNPDYVPQRTVTLEAEWERRFGDDGSLSLRVGHDWIQDLDGWVPITTATGVFDAPGNIGDGTNLRITGNMTTPLDSLGLSNAVIDVFLEWYNTNVTDPLTAMDRPWSGYREWELRLDYRQTFPEQQLAWGWDYFWLSDGEVFRAQEYRQQGFMDGDLDVYVETTRWFGVTTRLGVDAVFNNGDDRRRVFYNGSRAGSAISAIEYQNASMGPTWYLQVRGTF